jgi:hypothetical protein
MKRAAAAVRLACLCSVVQRVFWQCRRPDHAVMSLTPACWWPLSHFPTRMLNLFMSAEHFNVDKTIMPDRVVTVKVA